MCRATGSSSSLGRWHDASAPFGGATISRFCRAASRQCCGSTIDVDTNFATWVQWKLVIEPLHDALLEDALDKAERETGLPAPHRSVWSLRVRFLRWLVRRQAAKTSQAN